MLHWILILLVIAAVAGLLGLNAVSGLALTGAKVLIGIVLVFFCSSFSGLSPSHDAITPSAAL